MATLIQSLQHILSQTDPNLSNQTRRILMKELLQAYTLDYIYNHPAYRKLNFYGGTCLHLLYGHNRLSEDIDLDNTNQIDITHLEQDLSAYYRTTIAYDDVSTNMQVGESGIYRITLKFPILYALGLSSHANEVLNLKVEISTHAQTAEILKTPVLSHSRSFIASHFSLETMMAGKMLACLERNFIVGDKLALVKGRDFFDLLWFMQQKIIPMEEKLRKDGSVAYATTSAMEALKEKVAQLTPTELAVDLLPLFERRSFIDAWLQAFHENFERFVRYYLP
jgi:hypothetical protein